MGVLGAFFVYSADYEPRRDGPRERGLLYFAIAGAETGALIGVFLPMRRWTTVDARMLVEQTSARPDQPSLGV